MPTWIMFMDTDNVWNSFTWKNILDDAIKLGYVSVQKHLKL